VASAAGRRPTSAPEPAVSPPRSADLSPGGTGVERPPFCSLFSARARARISGGEYQGVPRTPTPCGWLIARTPARHAAPSRPTSPLVARPAPSTATGTVPTTTSASTTRSAPRPVMRAPVRPPALRRGPGDCQTHAACKRTATAAGYAAGDPCAVRATATSWPPG
jgi:hypothetical protein